MICAEICTFNLHHSAIVFLGPLLRDQSANKHAWTCNTIQPVTLNAWSQLTSYSAALRDSRATVPSEQINTATKHHEHTESYLLTCWQPSSLLAMCSWTWGLFLCTTCSLPLGHSPVKVTAVYRGAQSLYQTSQNTSSLVSSKLSSISKSFGTHMQNWKVFLEGTWTFGALN